MHHAARLKANFLMDAIPTQAACMRLPASCIWLQALREQPLWALNHCTHICEPVPHHQRGMGEQVCCIMLILLMVSVYQPCTCLDCILKTKQGDDINRHWHMGRHVKLMMPQGWRTGNTLRANLTAVRSLSIRLPFFLQGRSMRRRSSIVWMLYLLMSSALQATFTTSNPADASSSFRSSTSGALCVWRCKGVLQVCCPCREQVPPVECTGQQEHSEVP